MAHAKGTTIRSEGNENEHMREIWYSQRHTRASLMIFSINFFDFHRNQSSFPSFFAIDFQSNRFAFAVPRVDILLCDLLLNTRTQM